MLRDVRTLAMDGHAVVDGLRRTLVSSRRSAAFVEELEGRVRQLIADMVDGRVLPKPEADALRASIIELVRSEALPKFAGRNPNDALRIIDKLRAYRFTQLEGERPRLEAARASKLRLLERPAPASSRSGTRSSRSTRKAPSCRAMTTRGQTRPPASPRNHGGRSGSRRVARLTPPLVNYFLFCGVSSAAPRAAPSRATT